MYYKKRDLISKTYLPKISYGMLHWALGGNVFRLARIYINLGHIIIVIYATTILYITYYVTGIDVTRTR